MEAHRGLWRKRKYLQVKTGKKLSEKLLCVVLIHLTELQLSPQEDFF
ncbi:nef attachable domain protein [Chlamydia psittaci C1/97]|nr:nef attachable domain protein [Chlamydia psittaci C1/97]